MFEVLRPRYQKIRRDILENRTRTALVVSSIAIGVFAFGTILAGLLVTRDTVRAAYLATNPASATITTSAFDERLVDAVRHTPGVALAEGRRGVAARVRHGTADWVDMIVYVLPDDGVVSVNMVRPAVGTWPPGRHELLIERASLAKSGAAVGDSVTVEIPGQTARSIPVVGTAHDLSLPPAVISGQVFAYVRADTMRWLGGPSATNQVLFVVNGDRTDTAHIEAVAARVENVITRSGRPVITTDVPNPPLQHPAEVILPTLFTIMGVIGVLALLISTALIVNTLNAILLQQTRQIGVMKAIGARTDQITQLYFVLALAFGGMALVIALPASMLGSYGLERFIAGQLNVDIVGFSMPWQAVVLEGIAALLIPIAAAAAPIRGVVDRPAREALAGVSQAPVEGSPVDRILARLPQLSRPIRLALRNTFRRRSRLVRTLAALALGGAVFVSAMTLRSSLFTTLDASIASQHYDLEVQFNRQYRTTKVLPAVQQVPGVVAVEGLLRGVMYPVHADGTTGEKIITRAMPATTTMFAPRMVAGHWLRVGEPATVVLSTNIATKEPTFRVGETVTLRLNDHDGQFRIVGYIDELQPPINPALAYVTLDDYTALTGGVGRTDTLRVTTTASDAETQRTVRQQLEHALTDLQYDVRLIRTRSEDRAILADRFNLISIVLSVLSTIIATVGVLGLIGTMSMNVLERTREIGVMRAIGADDHAVRQVIVSEGVVIGVLAWVVGTVMSIPMSLLMCYVIGKNLLGSGLVWTYALPAALLWAAVVVALSVLASRIPARAAIRLTVREVLAYE